MRGNGGDFRVGVTVPISFETDNANGASATYTGGTMKIYKNGAGTAITAGITVTKDSPQVGLHKVAIDTSASASYVAQADYWVALETATVDGQTKSIWVGVFSLQNRYAGEVFSGVVQGGAVGQITLDAGESATDDILIGDFVFNITKKEMRQIIGWTGATKVAVPDSNWDVAPANLDLYLRLPGSLGAKLTDIATAVWANSARSLTGLAGQPAQDVWDALASASLVAGSLGKKLADYLTGLTVAQLNTAIAGVQTDTTNLLTKVPAALVGGKMSSTLGAGVEPAAVPADTATREAKIDYILSHLKNIQTEDVTNPAVIAWVLLKADGLTQLASRTDSLIGNVVRKGLES